MAATPAEPVRVRRLDHVGIAVRDVEPAVRLFGDLLGGALIGGGDNLDLDIRVVQLRFPPDVRVELLQPRTPGSYLARYLDRRGEGFHHLTFYVEDVGAAAEALTGGGVEVVDTDLDSPTWPETYLRPGSAFGALVQLAAPAMPWSQPLEGVGLADILGGRVHLSQNRAWWSATGEAICPTAPSADVGR